MTFRRPWSITPTASCLPRSVKLFLGLTFWIQVGRVQMGLGWCQLDLEEIACTNRRSFTFQCQNPDFDRICGDSVARYLLEGRACTDRKYLASTVAEQSEEYSPGHPILTSEDFGPSYPCPFPKISAVDEIWNKPAYFAVHAA